MKTSNITVNLDSFELLSIEELLAVRGGNQGGPATKDMDVFDDDDDSDDTTGSNGNGTTTGGGN